MEKKETGYEGNK